MTDTPNTDVLAARARDAIDWLHACGMIDHPANNFWAVYDMQPFVSFFATPQSDGTAIAVGEDYNPRAMVEQVRITPEIDAALHRALMMSSVEVGPVSPATAPKVASDTDLAAENAAYLSDVRWWLEIAQGKGHGSITEALEAAPHASKVASDTMRETDALKAAELVEWWDTGVLCDGLVRAEAAAMLAAGKADEHQGVRQAERAIIDRMIRAAALSVQSPAAGQDGEGVKS